MKFGKEFRKRRQVLLAFEPQDAFLDYISWKKALRSGSYAAIDQALEALADECKRVDRLFASATCCRCYKRNHKSCCYLVDWIKRYRGINNNDRNNDFNNKTNDDDNDNEQRHGLVHNSMGMRHLQTADLNQQCLRKLCKRLDKTFDAKLRTASVWMDTVMRSHTYAFLAGPIKTQLRLDFAGDCHHIKTTTSAAVEEPGATECPICFEEAPRTLIVFTCGHHACLSCVLGMCGLAGRKGTLLNLLSACRDTGLKCPLCREPHALKTLDVGVAVWPKAHELDFVVPRGKVTC
jgi:hypothetical protein